MNPTMNQPMQSLYDLLSGRLLGVPELKCVALGNASLLRDGLAALPMPCVLLELDELRWRAPNGRFQEGRLQLDAHVLLTEESHQRRLAASPKLALVNAATGQAAVDEVPAAPLRVFAVLAAVEAQLRGWRWQADATDERYVTGLQAISELVRVRTRSLRAPEGYAGWLLSYEATVIEKLV